MEEGTKRKYYLCARCHLDCFNFESKTFIHSFIFIFFKGVESDFHDIAVCVNAALTILIEWMNAFNVAAVAYAFHYPPLLPPFIRLTHNAFWMLAGGDLAGAPREKWSKDDAVQWLREQGITSSSQYERWRREKLYVPVKMPASLTTFYKAPAFWKLVSKST